MLTKTFNNVIRAVVTGEKLTFKRVDGTTTEVTIPNTVGSNFISYYSTTMLRIPELLKLGRYTTAVGNSSAGGVCFGTGTTAPTDSDYTITQKVLDASSGASVTINTSTDGNTHTGIYTIVNNGTQDLVITEVGLYGTIPYGSSQYYAYLIDRTLLESSVTIPAGGGVGKVVYSITIS